MYNIGIEFPERGQMAFFDLEAPLAPGPTEIQTRTHYSGITNGTERHALMADFGGRYPSRAGYQHVSVVEAVGSRVKTFAEGDVVFLGNHGGHRGWHIVDVTANNERERLCIKLPDDVEPEFCALFGVAGVGMRHSRRIRVAPPMNVWIAGMGLIGQSVAQASRALGARVTVTDVNSHRLDVANKLGAHRVINISEQSGIELLQADGPYDRIVDACGAPSLFEDIYKHKLLALYGAIGALAGRHETVFHQRMLHSLRASIESSSHFTLEDLSILLHFVRLGAIQIKPLVTHRVSITEAPRIYEIMRDRPADLLGVIFSWKP
ncbi:MAG: zinc-binding dehydrogenase [Candidatus Poribacteria bacterium]|nr:zinc-binding dehydrogenase [Candidatus Poribacteria bacterium]